MRCRSGCRRLGPALRGVFVVGARLDPARAFRCLFFFPERRTGLEKIHDEGAGVKGVAAMRRALEAALENMS